MTSKGRNVPQWGFLLQLIRSTLKHVSGSNCTLYCILSESELATLSQQLQSLTTKISKMDSNRAAQRVSDLRSAEVTSAPPVFSLVRTVLRVTSASYICCYSVFSVYLLCFTENHNKSVLICFLWVNIFCYEGKRSFPS